MIVLNFHGLDSSSRDVNESEERVWLDSGFFENVIHEVSKRSDVLITFDDGNKSDIDTALPILLSYGLRATFFISTDNIGNNGYLSASDIVELNQHNMTIGSHGSSHIKLNCLNTSSLTRQIKNSKNILEELLAKNISDFAIPFGSYNRKVLRCVRDAGFQKIFSSDRGYCDENSELINRNTLYKGDDIDSVKRILDCTKYSIFNIRQMLKTTIKSRI